MAAVIRDPITNGRLTVGGAKAKEINSKLGIEVLKTLAKLHFKTTKKLN